MHRTQQPSPVKWFGIYAAALSIFFLIIMAFAFVQAAPGSNASHKWAPHWLLVFGVCTPLALLNGAALFLPRAKFSYVYHMLMIVAGISSCMFPFALPLLIAYLKPEVKHWFGFDVDRA